MSQIAFANNGMQRMVATKQYDLLNRLTNATSVSSVASWFVYAYNSANQRTRTTLADGSYWVYAYDSLGQVISGKKYWSDGTAVACPVRYEQFSLCLRPEEFGRPQVLCGNDQRSAGAVR